MLTIVILIEGICVWVFFLWDVTSWPIVELCYVLIYLNNPYRIQELYFFSRIMLICFTLSLAFLIFGFVPFWSCILPEAMTSFNSATLSSFEVRISQDLSNSSYAIKHPNIQREYHLFTLFLCDLSFKFKMLLLLSFRTEQTKMYVSFNALMRLNKTKKKLSFLFVESSFPFH